MKTSAVIAPLFLLLLCSAAQADDFTALCADRAAIERVYHNHRLGEKPAFEQALPPATIEQLVRQELHKEAAFKKAYGVEVTFAMIEAEVQRINSTTRAPEVLAELKAALGNEAARFARALAKPIVVERLLRERFDNDDQLHAVQRREMERIRTVLTNAATEFRSSRGHEAQISKSKIEKSLLMPAATTALLEKLTAVLKANEAGSFSEVTWQLGSRPAPEPDGAAVQQTALTGFKAQAGPYAVEGTLQPAQVLSAPNGDASGRERKSYFEDLPNELQNVLRVQLRHPGDVSAVIELPALQRHGPIQVCAREHEWHRDLLEQQRHEHRREGVSCRPRQPAPGASAA